MNGYEIIGKLNVSRFISLDGANGKGSSMSKKLWLGYVNRCFYSQIGSEQQFKFGQLIHFNLVPLMHWPYTLQLKQ